LSIGPNEEAKIMQEQTPENGKVNEAVEESFPASDPPAYSTPHAEYQAASVAGAHVAPITWVMVAIAVILPLWLLSQAF
jgi:hypothetical protein